MKGGMLLLKCGSFKTIIVGTHLLMYSFFDRTCTGSVAKSLHLSPAEDSCRALDSDSERTYIQQSL